MNFANTPAPPYFAVIFTSVKNNTSEYSEVSKRMVELVQKQNGFLGFESAEQEIGITVSYWKNLDSILNWKNNFEHQEAQNLGRPAFYKSYKVRICKVEKEYQFGGTV